MAEAPWSWFRGVNGDGIQPSSNDLPAKAVGVFITRLSLRRLGG